MRLNTDKCHLLLNSQEPNTPKIGDLHLNNSLSEKLLCTTFDCKLKFNKTHQRYLPKSMAEVKRTCKTCTILGNNQKTYYYECVFQVII